MESTERIDAAQLEKEGLMEAARAMCVAARTAPKAKGTDNLVAAILTGAEKDRVAAEMQRIGESKSLAAFVRDAGNVRTAAALMVIGTRLAPLRLPSCGFCGKEDCDKNLAAGGVCAFNAGDLGIAIGSAVSMGADRRIDCRVMFTAGRAALTLEILGSDVRIAYGIPISVGPKSPFFDRK
jgi:uncharacterized ferredoxin-like protein